MLRRGDKIELIAPASGFTRVEYDSCLKFVNDIGLIPSVPAYDELIDSSMLFFANQKQKRFEMLKKAVLAKDSKAIWCMAGGYGSYQLLSDLENIKPEINKAIIGFSDNTVLLNYAVDKWGWQAIHGPMLKNLSADELTGQAVESIKVVIFGSDIKIENLIACNDAAKRAGELNGVLIGGCLSLMQVFIGTPEDVDYKDKILLLEDDRFESPQRISRILDHMIRAGIFNKVKAVILGSFLESDEQKDELKLAFTDLKQILDKQNKPLLWGKNLGHCPDMRPLVLGADVKIKLGDRPILESEFNLAGA